MAKEGKEGKKRKAQANGEASPKKEKKTKDKKRPSGAGSKGDSEKMVSDVNVGALTAHDKKNLPSHFDLVKGGQGMLFGCRVPKDYFICVGAGDTDEGGGMDPWETGSYDLALEEAHIEDFNIVPYTSVIPAESTEIDIDKVRESFHHGAVLETIMAKMNGSNGDRITAGVGMMKVRRKSDGHVYGGWAAEYAGHGTHDLAQMILHNDLEAMFKRRFAKAPHKLEDHEMFDLKFTVKEHEVVNQFGTVLAALCFCSYIYPLANPTANPT